MPVPSGRAAPLRPRQDLAARADPQKVAFVGTELANHHQLTQGMARRPEPQRVHAGPVRPVHQSTRLRGGGGGGHVWIGRGLQQVRPDGCASSLRHETARESARANPFLFHACTHTRTRTHAHAHTHAPPCYSRILCTRTHARAHAERDTQRETHRDRQRERERRGGDSCGVAFLLPANHKCASCYSPVRAHTHMHACTGRTPPALLVDDHASHEAQTERERRTLVLLLVQQQGLA